MIGHPVTEHNHVNENHSGNANAAIFSHCGRLMKQKCHYGIQDCTDNDGMHHHD